MKKTTTTKQKHINVENGGSVIKATVQRYRIFCDAMKIMSSSK